MSPWDAAVVAAKAVSYGATLAASGGVAFLAYSHPLVVESDVRRIRRCLCVLASVAAFAGIAKVLAMADSMSGDFTGMFDRDLDAMTLQAGEGRALAIRLTGLLLMMGSLVRAGRPAALGILGAAVAATSFGWTGHVHTLNSAPVPFFLIGAHLLGAAFWLGALLPLHLMTHGASTTTAAAAARFGSAALGVVAVLLAAGACLLCLLLHDVSELWTSEYGRLIAGKLTTVAALLGLAAVNHMSLTPRLLTHQSGAVNALRRSLEIEMSLACVILTVTAAMTTLTGPSH